MGFKGFVTSDWGAVHSVLFINQGLDMEMPGTLPAGSPLAVLLNSFFLTGSASRPGRAAGCRRAGGLAGGSIPEEPPPSSGLDAFPRDTDGSTMREALKNGTVSEATITAAARRVLYEMDRFGYLDGKQKHTVTPQDVEQNAAVIRKTAEDAAVLLKNDHALPLKAEDLQSLAFIGPGAGQVAAIGTFGERSRDSPNARSAHLMP